MNNTASTGRLTVRLTRDNGRMRAAGINVEINTGNVTYSGVTDQNGNVSFNINTPPFYMSQLVNSAGRPFAVVNIMITYPGFVSISVINQAVFPLTETIFSQNMVRLADSDGRPVKTIIIPTNHLYDNRNISLPSTGVMTGAASVSAMADTQEDSATVPFRKVVVPEFITVHMGPPNSDAQNITVPYIYYLKSVASSEIYPTWPVESLRANILAQNTLALNRIYTEWYRSQGYPFQITSSPAYDQYYVHDAGIFDTVSAVVDELFTNYLGRPGDFAPIFSSYCDGAMTTCDGLSQWGTVSLARQGLSAQDIVRYYYGKDIQIKTAVVVEILPDSFPGTLKRGSSGPDVAALQTRLNRIAIDFPRIPFIRAIDGEYGSGTEASVKSFQQIFALPTTGETDEVTWYRISYIYTAVTGLAELSSEGERPVSDEFPGRVLSVGSRGLDVLRMQYYLRVIAEVDKAIPQTAIDGVFDVDTRDAVTEFQRYYGLTTTGVIDKTTWDKIVNAYYYVIEQEGIIEPYPGTPLSVGSTGSEVIFIQKLLNRIAESVTSIPSVNEDGIFGEETEKAVKAFQSYYGLDADGIVGPETWNRLVSVGYEANGSDTAAKG